MNTRYLRFFYFAIWGLLDGYKATTLDGLNEAIKIAIEAVTQSDAKGWFKKAGYEA